MVTWPRDRFSPASLRAFANGPLTGEALEPQETLPSVADAHLEHLQAANRQLRDDLAAAERKADLLAELVCCVGGTLTPTGHGNYGWSSPYAEGVIAYLSPDEADLLREVLA